MEPHYKVAGYVHSHQDLSGCLQEQMVCKSVSNVYGFFRESTFHPQYGLYTTFVYLSLNLGFNPPAISMAGCWLDTQRLTIHKLWELFCIPVVVKYSESLSAFGTSFLWHLSPILVATAGVELPVVSLYVARTVSGELLRPSVGVFLQSSKDIRKSTPATSAFFIKVFAVLQHFPLFHCSADNVGNLLRVQTGIPVLRLLVEPNGGPLSLKI